MRARRQMLTPPRAILTLRRRRLYIHATMSTEQTNHRFDLELRRLEKRLEELVGITRQLQEENQSLRQRQDSLMTERASLLHKNEQVRGRVEAMIGRLKGMEQAS
jgi:cell division protein ZapB